MTTEVVNQLINIKHRLSRLQKIILAVLQTTEGLESMEMGRLGRLVAKRYGNNSFISYEDWKAKWQANYHDMEKMPEPDRGGAKLLLNFDLFRQKHNNRRHYGHRSNKFCVSFSRSLQNLDNQGLIYRVSAPYSRDPWVGGERCTAVGLTTSGRKLNVN